MSKANKANTNNIQPKLESKKLDSSLNAREASERESNMKESNTNNAESILDSSAKDSLDSAMKEISRGSSEFIGEDYIRSLVARFLSKGERFIVKAGFDPTAPDLHLGHTVLLSKLATFQRYGGDIKFVIGDFTARIGDPSGKSQTRKILSQEEVEQNAKTYKEQVFKILDPTHTEVCFNSSWIEKLGVSGIIALSSHFSVARMLERDDFTKRYKENLPISIIEFLYPLLQGYDSVALQSDMELGGNDQKFNLLVGRSLQRSYGLQKEQAIMCMPLLVGLDGTQKMSKSLGNYIGVTENPNTMYAKIMSICDDLMWAYYELLSSRSLKEIEDFKLGVKEGRFHPKAIKESLAHEITKRFYNEKTADIAKGEFNNVFANKMRPSDMPQMIFKGESWICKILQDGGLCSSTSQARRDIQAGALRINDEKISDDKLNLTRGEYVIQIGKRRFLKAIIQ